MTMVSPAKTRLDFVLTFRTPLFRGRRKDAQGTSRQLPHFYSERREDVSGIRNIDNGNSKIALKNGRLEISLPYSTTKHDGNSKSALEN